MSSLRLPATWVVPYTRYLEPHLPSWQAVKADLWPRGTVPHVGLASPLLWMLLLTDVGFILAHFMLFYTDLLGNELFSLRKDQGYAEFFQYLKAFWIGFLLVWQTRRAADPRYLVWAALFGYMLADDYLMLHENIGAAAAIQLGIGDRWGLRGQDFGELGFYMLVGGFFFVLLLIAYSVGSRNFRRASVGLFALIFVFAFFAVVADLLHIMLPFPALERVFDVIEDGGEMAAMSLILWFVYARLLLNRRFARDELSR